jgi:hypothetical protein
MRNKLIKIALTASFGLAMSFTLSCSDDEKSSGGYLGTCQEMYALIKSCDTQYAAEFAACDALTATEMVACWAALQPQVVGCYMAGCPSGTSEQVCQQHYLDMGCEFDDEGDECNGDCSYPNEED